MKFKIGDTVSCVTFNGVTGEELREMSSVLFVDFVDKAEDTFLVVRDGEGKRVTAHAYRFVHVGLPPVPMNAAEEYDEIMLADKLVNG